MSQLKQSVCWWCFAGVGMEPKQLLRAAADIGYAAVELVEPQYWSLVKDYGLTIASTNGGMSIEQGLNRREHHQHLEQQIRTTILQAEAGVTLVMELLNSKVDHHDYQCDHTSWGIEVCRMVNSPRVKLLYDIYHMQIMEGDIIRTIRESSEWFGHYHTAGNPGRHELDETQELYYPPIIRTILETGYDGYLGQEFLPLGDPRKGLKQAFDLCNLSL